MDNKKKQNANDSPMLSQRQAADFLKIDPATLAKHRGLFKTQRLRQVVLYDLAELEEFKNKFSVNTRGIKSK